MCLEFLFSKVLRLVSAIGKFQRIFKDKLKICSDPDRITESRPGYSQKVIRFQNGVRTKWIKFTGLDFNIEHQQSAKQIIFKFQVYGCPMNEGTIVSSQSANLLF